MRREEDFEDLTPIENPFWPACFWDLFTPDPELAVPEPLAMTEVDLDE